VQGVGAGSVVSASKRQLVVAPYVFATFGDSRANNLGGVTAPSPDASSALFTPVRAPSWVLAYMGDISQIGNFGVSGDGTSSWNSSSRLQSKTISAFAALGTIDLTHVQYGINNYYASSTVVADYITLRDATVTDLKNLTRALLANGSKVIFESINHCTVTAYASDAATKRNLTNEINSIMSAYIAGLPQSMVRFVDTNRLLVDANGYGDVQYYSLTDALPGVHFNQYGARISGKEVSRVARLMLPDRQAVHYSALPTKPNMCRFWPGLAYLGSLSVSGTHSGLATAAGFDDATGRHYVDMSFNVTALASGTAQVRFDIGVAVGSYGGATPDFTVSVGDELRADARIVVGVNVSALAMRHRIYKQAGGSIFNDWGDVGDVQDAAFPDGESVWLTTPKFVTDTASSGIQAPGNGTGYVLQVFVRSLALGAGGIRVYLPDVRRTA
jgi:hypothetical protein